MTSIVKRVAPLAKELKQSPKNIHPEDRIGIFMTNTSTPQSFDWSTCTRQLYRLDGAWSALNNCDQVSSVAQQHVEKSMDACIETALRQDMQPDIAIKIFFGLPLPYIEAALIGQSNKPARQILNIASEKMKFLNSLPEKTMTLSIDSLNALKNLGFPYDDLIGSGAAEAWIARGSEFGENAFRKDHPRKRPVMAYWEKRGLRFPRRGLSDEGRQMMIKEIRNLSHKTATAAFLSEFEKKPSSTDWRLLLAILCTSKNPPQSLLYRYNWRSALPTDMFPDMEALFCTVDSSHARLDQVRRLQAAPSIEEFFDMPKYPRPEKLSDILPTQ